VQESSHLIGVAFVPLKSLIEGNGRTRTTGLYDVVAKEHVFKSLKTLNSIDASDSLGKLKVAINSSLNIKKIISPDQTIPLESILFQRPNPAVTFAKKEDEVEADSVRSSQVVQLEDNVRKYKETL